MMAVSMLVGACTKLKDKNYDAIISDQFTPQASDLVSLVGPAYGSWRGLMGFGGSNFFRTQEVSADLVVIPARPYGWVDDGSYRRLHEHTWTNTDGTTGNWGAAYNGITNCNRVIYQIESGTIPVEVGKENTLAELRALRASFYWALCDIFGNVPIVTRFDVEDGFLPEQNTRQEVYDFIVSEITEVMPLLSDEVSKTWYARFNKWAATALLAKMYLNAGVYSGTPQWEKCIEACDAIINSGKFSLETTQKALFATNNEGARETIFAIPYDELFAGGFSLHMETLHPENQKTYNLQTSSWGGIVAIPQHIDTYDPQDLRLKENWIQGQQYSSSGVELKGGYGPFTGQPLNFINEVPGVDSTQEVHGYHLGKYEYKMGARTDLSNDVPFFRYSDVLMMKAECLLRTGKAAEAAELVTQVRMRSFPDNPAKATVTGAQLEGGSSYDYGLRNYKQTTHEGGADIQYGRMLDELAWEFNQEAHRRQDLIRFGVFTKKSWLSHKPNGEYRTLMPIPASVINTNPKITQNPGY